MEILDLYKRYLEWITSIDKDYNNKKGQKKA